MAYYNYKELRDALPPEMVEKWSQEDGSADYDSTLWSYGAEYIEQLKRQLAETREEAENWRNNITPATEERLLFSWENAGAMARGLAAQDSASKTNNPAVSG